MTAVFMREVSRQPPGGNRPLVDQVTLEIDRGELVNLAGQSGAGKTSLLRLVNRLDEPTAGEIQVLGRSIHDWPVRELRRKAAFVFQEPVLVGKTVRDALAMVYQVWGDGSADIESNALEVMLENVRLGAPFLERNCQELSIGQKQRVSIARALLTRPEILLLDEPTSGLDEQTGQELLEFLLELNQSQGVTILIANHRMAEVQYLGGRLVVLRQGSVVADGSVHHLFKNPPSKEVSDFLKGSQRKRSPAEPDEPSQVRGGRS